MKMKCLYASMLRGDVVKPGQVVDIDDREAGMDVVKAFFVKVEGDGGGGSAVPPPASGKGATEAAAKPQGLAGLTRDQAIMKLAQAGVKVKGRTDDATLAEIYAQTFANVAEATAK